MINFFRKIRKQLADDNPPGGRAGKPLKYLRYAIGEIVLVVIGILIALQINTWNQERSNAKEERRIFQDLSEELQFNKFLVNNGSRTMGEVMFVAEQLLNKINAPEIEFKEEEFNRHIDKLTVVWLSGRPTTLYDVLSGSGDFSLISSSVIRKKLADLKGNLESLLKWEETQNQFVDQQLRPFLNGNVDRTKVRSIRKSAELITTRYSSVFPPNSRELLQNREFANLLVDLIFFTQRITDTYVRIDRDITEIDSLIHAKYSDIKAKPYIPY